jgi:hypothetical protein
MRPQDAAGLAAIHAAFAEDQPVRYTGAGLVNAPLVVVKRDEPAADYMGEGNTLRRVSFEVQKADLPADPDKGDEITEADGQGTAWRVNDLTPRDDIGAWVLVVEIAP